MAGKPASAVNTMGYDLDKYRPHVDEFDLTDEQKQALLKSIWDVMESFVDRSFQDDPVQQIRGKERDSDGIPSGDVLDSGNKEFNDDGPAP